MLMVPGKGTDLSEFKPLQSRAKRKVISRSVILALIDVAKENKDYTLVKSLWNAYRCHSSVITFGDKLYTKYCKNRICTICAAIRKADFINRYCPILKDWDDAHFLTLTIRAVPEEELQERIDRMYATFKKIHQKLKKRHQRGKGIKVMGIKSLECNFNPIKRTYNPHFHIIVPSREVAILLEREWLSLLSPSFALQQAQQFSPIKDLEKGLIELIKYGSKIFTDPEMQKKMGSLVANNQC